MAFVPSYLKGLISLGQLSLETGLSASRLQSYVSGAIIPRAPSFNLLKKSYTNLQMNRLFSAGLNPDESKRLADNAPKTVSHMVNKTNRAVNTLTAQINLQKIQAGKKLVDPAAITFGMRNSGKTAEQVWAYEER